KISPRQKRGKKKTNHTKYPASNLKKCTRLKRGLTSFRRGGIFNIRSNLAFLKSLPNLEAISFRGGNPADARKRDKCGPENVFRGKFRIFSLRSTAGGEGVANNFPNSGFERMWMQSAVCDQDFSGLLSLDRGGLWAPRCGCRAN